MNVIVFTTWAVQRFMSAIHGEIIEKHLKKGDNVKVVVCNSELHSCGLSHVFMKDLHSPPFKENDTCLDCQYKWLDILKNDLHLAKEDIIPMTPFPKDGFIPTFTTKEDVENCFYDGINVGVGILSSIITITQDLDVDIIKYRPALEAIYKNTVASILTMQNLSKTFSPDYVSIYNGRMAERRAVVNFCQSENIAFHTWEIAQSEEHYYTVENTLPHNPKSFAEGANHLFFEDKRQTQEEKIAFAKNWYEKKRGGNYEGSTNDINYTVYMKDKNIDALNIDKTKTNIALFVSSEDEIASIGKEVWPFEYRQTETISRVIEHFKDKPDFHFYLRIHPNLRFRNNDNKETQKLHNFDASCITVIPAESPINSYALLDACDKIVSFASTVGIEATYWQKPSISFGTSSYMYIKDAVYVVDSFEDLFDFIADKNLLPKPQEGALVYSYGLENQGTLLEELGREIYKRENVKTYKKNKIVSLLYDLYKKFGFVEKIIANLRINRLIKKVMFRWNKMKQA